MIDPLIIPLAALVIPIIVVPTAMGFKHAAKLRDLDHAERMRALELGRPGLGDEPWPIRARVNAAIGAGVPIVAMIVAFLASLVGESRPEMWNAAGMIGVAGVICGSCLAAQSRKAEDREAAVAKPAYDREAFEFTGPHA